MIIHYSAQQMLFTSADATVQLNTNRATRLQPAATTVYSYDPVLQATALPNRLVGPLSEANLVLDDKERAAESSWGWLNESS